MHACARTRTHARTHTHTYTHIRARARTHAHARTRTHMHACARTRTHAHTHTHTRTHTHTCTHARMHAHIYLHIHTSHNILYLCRGWNGIALLRKETCRRQWEKGCQLGNAFASRYVQRARDQPLDSCPSFPSWVLCRYTGSGYFYTLLARFDERTGNIAFSWLPSSSYFSFSFSFK